MAKQSIKSRNKQLKRRLDGLKSKCYRYGKLDGIKLALIVEDLTKGQYYTYRSKDWRPSIGEILAHPNSKNELPGNVEKNGVIVEHKQASVTKRRTKKTARGATASEKSTPEGSTPDTGQPKGWVDRDVLVIPEPPSFDLTMLKEMMMLQQGQQGP